MMGRTLEDPYGVEEGGTLRGLGLLDTVTVFSQDKVRTQATGTIQTLPGILSGLSHLPVEGYEIHMGKTEVLENQPIFSLVSVPGCEQKLDGCCKDHLYGTYLHGLFESGEITSAFARALLQEKGYDCESIQTMDLSELREQEYDKLAEILRNSLDMEKIYEILEAGA